MLKTLCGDERALVSRFIMIFQSPAKVLQSALVVLIIIATGEVRAMADKYTKIKHAPKKRIVYNGFRPGECRKKTLSA